jgi:hypothetical protein
MGELRAMLKRVALQAQEELTRDAWDLVMASESVPTPWWEVSITAVDVARCRRLGEAPAVPLSTMAALGARPNRLDELPEGLEDAEREVLAALTTEPLREREIAALTGYRVGRYLHRVLRSLWRQGLVVEHVRGWRLP